MSKDALNSIKFVRTLAGSLIVAERRVLKCISPEVKHISAVMYMLSSSALNQLSWFPQESGNSITANPAYGTWQSHSCPSHAILCGVMATVLPALPLATLKLACISLYRQLLYLCLEHGLILQDGTLLGPGFLVQRWWLQQHRGCWCCVR